MHLSNLKKKKKKKHTIFTIFPRKILMTSKDERMTSSKDARQADSLF